MQMSQSSFKEKYIPIHMARERVAIMESLRMKVTEYHLVSCCDLNQ